MALISKVTIVIDGEQITGFAGCKENDIEEAQEVELADSVDTIDIPKKYGFQLRVNPKKGADRDWTGTKDATAILQYEGGSKVVYTGCRLLKQSFSENNGKTAKEYSLEFSAQDRKPR